MRERRGSLRPDVSVGAGYNFLSGAVSIAGLLDSNITINNFEVPGDATYTLALTNPDLTFAWETNVIDLKIQASKRLLFFRPFVGAGASTGFARAGGGLDTALLLNGSPPTQQQLDDIVAFFEAANQPVPDLTADGIRVAPVSQTGWSFRAFGGIGLQLLFIKVDVLGSYDINSGAYGLTGNLRFQL